MAPGRRIRSAALTVGLLLGALVAPLSPGAAEAGAPGPAAAVHWTACPRSPGFRCGTLPVPLDYRHPGHGSLRLAVIEHPVPHSRGVVIFNPGGPGESGVLILPLLASLVPPAVRARLSLVSFDERGTGSSEPLLCGPSPAAASSAAAGSPAAARTFAGLERSCRTDDPALFPTVSTTTSARDMERLREALGVGSVDYYGLSYGTVLGSVYRQLYPRHVGAMVLDGAVDADASLAADATAEAPAIEDALVHELTGCTASPGCPLGPDPVGTFRDLQRRLERMPLPPPGSGDTLPVTAGDLATATLLYLSVPALTPGYLPALRSASAGDGGPLRSVALGLETDLDGSSLVGPLWTITCNDAATHPDATATAELARSLQRRYPLGGGEAVANNLVGCPGWTNVGQSPVARLAPGHAPTPLVVGTTHDPNTPYPSARRLASAIGGRLLTYDGYGHTWLLNGSDNPCMQRAVGRFLLTGTLPVRGAACAG